MISRPRKCQIVYALQDFYFCETGERKVHKKLCLMHFSRNKKETNVDMLSFVDYRSRDWFLEQIKGVQRKINK